MDLYLDQWALVHVASADCHEIWLTLYHYSVVQVHQVHGESSERVIWGLRILVTSKYILKVF